MSGHTAGMDDRGHGRRDSGARAAWAWATFAVVAPVVLRWLDSGRYYLLVLAVGGSLLAVAATVAGGRLGARRDRPAPAPDPVPAVVRAVDTLWLVTVAGGVPYLGLGLSCPDNDCDQLRAGLWALWGGLGLVFGAYLSTLHPRAGDRWSRVVAAAFIPATVVVTFAGMSVLG